MKISYQNSISFERAPGGTPIIKTTSEEDFYYAMGFAHATDRAVQLLLMRILGRGQATELLLDNDEMFGVDEFFRKMNWKTGVEEEINKFSEEELKLATAYCDGINAVILKKRPLELKLIGYKPEKWTLADSILISRIVGYVSLAQSQGEIERFFLQLVQTGVTEEKLNELFPKIIDGADLEKIKTIKFSEKIVPDGIKWTNMISAAIASNNWIVSGDRSSSGKPILANDPHLETNRLPNIWHELQISLNDRYFIGCTMPGMPACLIGRTNDLAWGATYTFMDAIDSWMEDVENAQYLRDGNRYPFQVRKEIIKRKKKGNVEVTFFENEHGVLDGDPNKDGLYLSTKWASDRTGHQSVRAIRNMFHSKTVEEGMANIGQLEPSFNWVISDTQGNIGYQMSGRMPKRHPNWNGFYPAAGWDSQFDWKGFETPEDLPRVINPYNGYFITCNQDLNEYGTVKPINIAMGDYRYRRVKQLLEKNKKHEPKDFMSYQNDLYSLQAEEIIPMIIPYLEECEHSSILRSWNFTYHPDERGAVIFEDIYKALIFELLSVNLGKDVADHLLTKTGILADFYLNFDQILHNKTSPWFEFCSREVIIKKAISHAIQQPIRRWGDVNRITMINMFFGGKMPKILGFDKGPIELKGGRATVHQGQIYTSAGRITSFTPSYRMITDMATDEVHSSLAGGASGNRFSKYYANEIDDWCQGIYKKLSKSN